MTFRDVQNGIVFAQYADKPLKMMKIQYMPFPLNQFIAYTPVSPTSIVPNLPANEQTPIALALNSVSQTYEV